MSEKRKYCPSNGSDGDWFEDKFCMNCIHTNLDPAKKPQCQIWCAAVCHHVNEPGFPKEWIYDDNNQPTCTAWVKWDWGNDGDPNDPDNPNYRPPDDPNQLCMPFALEEMQRNVTVPQPHYA